MHPIRLTARATLALASFLAATGAGPAHAQQDTPSASPGEAGEIVVTATRRTTRLQETPAAITVLGARVLELTPAPTIEGLSTLVPTLNFRKGGTTLNSSLFLRGVGTINFSIAAEPSVAFVLDGVVLARSGEAFGDLYDIERIEVLRGPQGTLFGKNASAGVVNIITRTPGSVYAGEIEGGYFSDEEKRLRGAIDLPLGESVRSRLTFALGSLEGNIENLARGEDVNGYDRAGVRGVVDIDLSETARLRFIGDYRRAEDDCCAEVIGAPPPGPNQAAVRALLAGVDFQGEETEEIRQNLITATREDVWGLSLQGDFELASGHTLTAIAAFRQYDNIEIRDGDWLDRTAPYVGNAFAQLHDFGPQESNTISTELRITSPDDGALSYIGGLYYYHAFAERIFRRDVTVCTASTLALDATGQRPCAPGLSTFVSDSSTAQFGSTLNNYAVFVDGSLDLSRLGILEGTPVRLIGGLRYTNDDLEYFHRRRPASVALPGIRTDTTGFEGSTNENNISGRAGIQVQATPDLLAYGTYSRGYKGPAFNVFFNMTAQQRNVIEAETADAFEVGLKSEFFEGAVVANIAAYYTEYENFQANAFDTLNGVVITRLTNAGEIVTQGVELDFSAQPIDDLVISGGVAYTDATIDRFRDANGRLSSAREGERLALAPRWKGSVTADYLWRTGTPVDIRLGATYAYTSSQFSDIGANPLLRIDETNILDLFVGFLAFDETVRLTLFAKNVTDERYATLITPGGPGGALRYQIPRESGAFYGATLNYRWGG